MAECDCREETKVSKIKLDDRGGERTATFLNKEKVRHIKIRVDGCLIKQETAADWILSKPDVGHIVVELKGSDVDHAIEQVLATAKLAEKERKDGERIAALIACTRYPKIDTKVQRGKQRFSDLHNGRLHIVTKSCEHIFEEVLGLLPKRK
ncbi:hypothetical protein [Burkholderia gladioli]|uniref:hypothetical protein n=1 Tax=Burkholderia gladioli TaxID=28095 RepID=UPI001640D626|nr:hypothetical protein [Burkholderia gladioli]